MYGSYPRDIFKIIDNTVITDSTFNNVGPVLLQPFVSDKGIDGQIVDLKSFGKTIKEYGYPNTKLHGQAIHDAYAWLEAGGIVKGCRITAKDSTYSNLLIKLIVQVVEEQLKDKDGKPLYTDATTKEQTTVAEGNTPIMEKRAKVKLVPETFTTLSQLDEDIEVIMKSKYKDGETNNGIYEFPLYIFASKGRGEYGDNFRIRLTPNSKKDKDSKYRNYTFELLSNEEGLTKLEVPLNVTSHPFGKDFYNKSLYIEDVLKRNIYPIMMSAVDDYYYEIVDLLLPVIQQSSPNTNEENMDMLFFIDKDTGIKYKHVDIEIDSLNMSQYEGFPLQSGSDGSFARTNPDRMINIYERYKDFYLGKIDNTINDIRMQKFAVVLDANLPLEVKNAMIALNVARKGDHKTYVDAGVMHTLLDAKSWAQNEMIVDNYNIELRIHNFMTSDKYTGKEMLVTETFAIANELPKFILANGDSAYKPFAGVDIPLNKYIIEGTLRPVVTEDDKQDLVDLRLNYIEYEDNKYIFATQLTSQDNLSALSDGNNVFILHEIMRDVRALSPYLRYNPTETQEDMKEINRKVNARVEPYADYKVARCFAEVTKSTDPNDTKTIYTKIYTQFKSYSEVNDITIEINRS